MSFEMYRESRVGDCLVDALQVLLDEGKISKELAFNVLKQFDQTMLEALQHHVPGKAMIKADLDHYKYYDNVWQFHLANVTFKLNPTGSGSALHAPAITCERAKIVCVDAKLLEAP